MQKQLITIEKNNLDFIYILLLLFIYSKDFDTNNLEEVYVGLHYINSYCYFYLKDYIYIYIKNLYNNSIVLLPN